MNTVTQQINDWIANEGEGDMRDALNIALARLESAEAMIKILREQIVVLENVIRKGEPE